MPASNHEIQPTQEEINPNAQAYFEAQSGNKSYKPFLDFMRKEGNFKNQTPECQAVAITLFDMTGERPPFEIQLPEIANCSH